MCTTTTPGTTPPPPLITVPTYFNSAQRQATKDASQIPAQQRQGLETRLRLKPSGTFFFFNSFFLLLMTTLLYVGDGNHHHLCNGDNGDG